MRKGIEREKLEKLKKNLKSKDQYIIEEVISYIDDALRDLK